MEGKPTPTLETKKSVPDPDHNPNIKKELYLVTNFDGVKTERYRYSTDPAYPGYERTCTVVKEIYTPEKIALETSRNRKILDTYRALAKEAYIEEKRGERIEKRPVNLSLLMSGESPKNSAKMFMYSFPPGSDLYKKHGYKSPYPGAHFIGLMNPKWQTGRDLEWLGENFPKDTYKFYLSFDLSTPEKKRSADNFIKEVIEECVRQKITLSTKSFDHDYDSYNLYTGDRDAMIQLLKTLYPKYAKTGMFLDATRYFQAPIDGINPNHIAWVQEPLAGSRDSQGRSYHSHSGRMGLLGQLVENGKSYEEACAEVGVRPEAPWLLADNKSVEKK